MATATTVKNRRKDARTDLAWPVSLWLPEANRFFNAHSLNISKGGALLSAPMSTPVRAGHVVEINFPRTTALAKEKGQFARIKNGKVIRVNRKNILTDGNICIAVQFTQS